MRHDFSKVNRKKAAVVAGLCIVFLGIIFYAFRGPSAVNEANKGKIMPDVALYQIERKDMMRRVSLFGETVPEAHIDLAPKYAGRITAVNVKLGDRVRAGDVLIVQDTLDLDLSVRQNQAAARQAEADAKEAESVYAATYSKVHSDFNLKKQNYERYQSLYEQGAISKENLDTVYQQMIDSQSALDTLLNQAMSGEVPASVESKRAALLKAEEGTKSLEKQRYDLLLRAPRDGVIGYRAAEVGAIAQAGQKVLELVDNSKIYVDCQVSEQDVAAIQAGVSVDVNIESLGKSYAGKIIYISPSTAANSKSYSVRIELASYDALIKAGMFARTQIEIMQRPATLFIPKESVQEKNGKISVFVIGDDHKATERFVTLGLRNDAEVEVLEGLQEGEAIAVTNMARLKDGVTVNVSAAGAPS